eukprot:TRINITY_DN3719_c0_g1_i1.p1 TRINITY_DN3719_c0_g1~~TRINITY_DN3719_c0_g1_i1.p1  ORF type:complete len:295 (-),score=34.16 TRINITY_DN3719_c0_g1_i1:402-1286(-)
MKSQVRYGRYRKRKQVKTGTKCTHARSELPANSATTQPVACSETQISRLDQPAFRGERQDLVDLMGFTLKQALLSLLVAAPVVLSRELLVASEGAPERAVCGDWTFGLKPCPNELKCYRSDEPKKWLCVSQCEALQLGWTPAPFERAFEESDACDLSEARSLTARRHHRGKSVRLRKSKMLRRRYRGKDDKKKKDDKSKWKKKWKKPHHKPPAKKKSPKPKKDKGGKGSYGDDDKGGKKDKKDKKDKGKGKGKKRDDRGGKKWKKKKASWSKWSKYSKHSRRDQATLHYILHAY